MYEQVAQKQASHLDLANEMTLQILNYPHEQQVEIVNKIRENLIKERQAQNECLVKEHEEHSININRHSEGTKVIASAL